MELNNYKLGPVIGAGAFGSVRIANEKASGRKVAIKFISKGSISDIAEVERVSREFFILTSLEHKNVIRLYEVFQDDECLYLIMEFAGGGSLDGLLAKAPGGRLPEKEARKVFAQIVGAVRYCHRKHVIHRDLKPENILLSTNNSIKVADFGLSNTVQYGSRAKSPVGTPLYAAPEILFPAMYPNLDAGPTGSAAATKTGREGGGGAGGAGAAPSNYDNGSVDVWSCGVILYRMLTGRLPFPADNIRQLKTLIFDHPLPLPPVVDGETVPLSSGAEALLRGMLQREPSKRMTAEEVGMHPWLDAGGRGSLPSLLLETMVAEVRERLDENGNELPSAAEGGEGTAATTAPAAIDAPATAREGTGANTAASTGCNPSGGDGGGSASEADGGAGAGIAAAAAAAAAAARGKAMRRSSVSSTAGTTASATTGAAAAAAAAPTGTGGGAVSLAGSAYPSTQGRRASISRGISITTLTDAAATAGAGATAGTGAGTGAASGTGAAADADVTPKGGRYEQSPPGTAAPQALHQVAEGGSGGSSVVLVPPTPISGAGPGTGAISFGTGGHSQAAATQARRSSISMVVPLVPAIGALGTPALGPGSGSGNSAPEYTPRANTEAFTIGATTSTGAPAGPASAAAAAASAGAGAASGGHRASVVGVAAAGIARYGASVVADTTPGAVTIGSTQQQQQQLQQLSIGEIGLMSPGTQYLSLQSSVSAGGATGFPVAAAAAAAAGPGGGALPHLGPQALTSPGPTSANSGSSPGGGGSSSPAAPFVTPQLQPGALASPSPAPASHQLLLTSPSSAFDSPGAVMPGAGLRNRFTDIGSIESPAKVLAAARAEEAAASAASAASAAASAASGAEAAHVLASITGLADSADHGVTQVTDALAMASGGGSLYSAANSRRSSAVKGRLAPLSLPAAQQQQQQQMLQHASPADAGTAAASAATPPVPTAELGVAVVSPPHPTGSLPPLQHVEHHRPLSPTPAAAAAAAAAAPAPAPSRRGSTDSPNSQPHAPGTVTGTGTGTGSAPGSGTASGAPSGRGSPEAPEAPGAAPHMPHYPHAPVPVPVPGKRRSVSNGAPMPIAAPSAAASGGDGSHLPAAAAAAGGGGGLRTEPAPTPSTAAAAIAHHATPHLPALTGAGLKLPHADAGGGLPALTGHGAAR